VLSLLKKKSQTTVFVVFSSGEGLKLDFDPSKLPALPSGWLRDYFFYANGFEKDLDFYAPTPSRSNRYSSQPAAIFHYPAGKDSDATHPPLPARNNTRQRSNHYRPRLRYPFSPIIGSALDSLYRA